MCSLVTCRSVGFNGTGGSDYRLGPVGEFLLHLITQDSRFVVNEAVVTPIDEGGYPEQACFGRRHRPRWNEPDR